MCSSPSLSISLWNQSCCHCVSPSGSIYGRGSPCVPTLKPFLPTLPLVYPDSMFLFCSASSAPVFHKHLVFPQPHSPSYIPSCSPEPSSPTCAPCCLLPHAIHPLLTRPPAPDAPAFHKGHFLCLLPSSRFFSPGNLYMRLNQMFPFYLGLSCYGN